MAGSGRGMRGRTSVFSTVMAGVMAGMAINSSLEHTVFDDVSTITHI
jgi:hypothetical protein